MTSHKLDRLRVVIPGLAAGLLAAAGCQVGEGAGGDPRALDITIEIESEGSAAIIGSYADGVINLDRELIDTFTTVTVDGETMSLPTELYLGVGDRELVVNAASPSVAVAEPLAAGDQLTLRVVRDGESLAELALNLEEDADYLYSATCWPVSQWSRTSTEGCGSCPLGKRRAITEWGWNIMCSDGRRFQVYSGWNVYCLNFC